MVGSNTETGVAVSYDDSDNTLDFVLGTAQTTIESVKNTSLAIGRDDDNLIKFSTDNQIIFEVSGGDNVIFKASGEIEATSLDISGDADIDGTLEADAITVNGSALATVIAGTTVTSATNAAHVSVADNENTNEENLIPFIEDASATGNVGLESDGDFAYNPSTGTVTATIFKGNIDAVDGDFDGTLEADAITVGGTNISSIYSVIAGSSNIVTTGALNSGSITSGFGTIDTGSSTITTTGLISGGSLDIDNVLINGTTIGHTDDTDLITVADGLVTVAGEVQMTTLDIGGTNVTATAAELNFSDLATLGTTAASKVYTADANGLTKISGAALYTEDTLTDGSTVAWDVIASPVAKLTMAGNRTLSAPSGTTPAAGQFVSLLLIQDGSGSRTITFNAVYEFTGDVAPTLTTTANKGDLFVFRYNGSKWLEVGRNLNLTLS